MDPLVFAAALQRAAIRPKRWRTLISLTPLIDVVFILLVFFMLASSFQDWHVIELDEAYRPGTTGPRMEGALLVEVRPNGLWLSAEPLSLEALVTSVGRHVTREPDVRVLVRPAQNVALQEVVRVLDALAATGATALSLIRDQNRRVLSRGL